MRNKREAEPDFFDVLVDVKVWDTTSTKERISAGEACRLTAKRIYTPGGAVYDRKTGKRLLSRAYSGMTWNRRALLETLRPNPAYMKEKA